MLEESVMSLPSLWSTLTSWFTPSILFLLLNLMIATIALSSSLTSPKPKDDSHPDDPFPPQQPPHLPGSPSVLQRLKSINFYLYSHRSQPPEEKEALFSQSYREGHPGHREEEHESSDSGAPFYRSPSSLLGRVRSFNISRFVSPEMPNSDQTPAPEQESPHPFRHEDEGEVEDDIAEEGGEDDEDDKDGEDEVLVEKETLDEIYSRLKENSNHAAARSRSETGPRTSGRNVPEVAEKMRKSASAREAVGNGGDGGEAVEARRPATVREGRGKMVADEEVDAKADDFINKFKQQLKLQRLDSILRYKEMIGRGVGSGSGK